MTHAFTVDLEEWFHGIELPRTQWPSSSRLEVGLDRLLALLDRHQVTATFFVLGAVAARFPQRVAELATLGHEIGCHGHFHDFVYKLPPQEFREDVRRARDTIADASGVSPVGYRAPYFSITRESLWALEILAEEGFTYDSSVFPVHNDRYGIPGTPTKPYRHVLQSRDLLEIPQTPLKVFGVNVPFAGGAYMRILPWWSQALAWRAATRRGMSVVAYVHPWELDPEHPRIPLRRRVSATHYARLEQTASRLERLLSTYEFGRVDSVIRL